MLRRAHRLRRADDFRHIVRKGRRFASPFVVCYRLSAPVDGPLIGVVVSKRVGGSVVRNRLRRQIQAICAGVIQEANPHQMIVIRALPGAADLEWDTLRSDVAAQLRRAVASA